MLTPREGPSPPPAVPRAPAPGAPSAPAADRGAGARRVERRGQPRGGRRGRRGQGRGGQRTLVGSQRHYHGQHFGLCYTFTPPSDLPISSRYLDHSRLQL